MGDLLHRIGAGPGKSGDLLRGTAGIVGGKTVIGNFSDAAFPRQMQQ